MESSRQAFMESEEYKLVTNFFATAPELPNFHSIEQQIHEFVSFHSANGTPIALVTSGGTAIPLEKNTVRFLDNFSTGKRGAASAECFINEGYAVIFLHRRDSVQPFARHFALEQNQAFLSHFQVSQSTGNLEIAPEFQEKLRATHKDAQKAKESRMLLSISFFSLIDLLRTAALSVRPAGKKAVIFLAAAVSDFYLPPEQMAEHKIQSRSGPLLIQLPPVPKVIRFLKCIWAPEAYLISFKLETDSNLLVGKVATHTKRFEDGGNGVDCCIGNILGQHHHSVTIFFGNGSDPVVVKKTEAEVAHHGELEPRLISLVKSVHSRYFQLESR